MSKLVRIGSFVVAAAFLLASLEVQAQNTYASLTGTVTDPSGNVVSGAKVTVVNTSTEATRAAASDNSGTYTVNLLPAGTYRVSVESPGFSQEVKSGIVLEVDQHAREDFHMSVGAVQQTVEVQTSEPLVESESSSVGQTISNHQVVQLPLNGRNFLNLTLMSAGVAPTTQEDPEAGNPAEQIAFSTAGARSTMTSFLLDGMPNTDDATDFIVTRASIDSIQEFRVETNTYSAEFGRYGGGQVNMTTKSGTNQFHSSLYEFFRNDDLDGRNFFESPAFPKASYHRNQFGGSLGGPIKTDKVFFFGSYEGLRLAEGLTGLTTVPTNQMLQCVKSSQQYCDLSQLPFQLVNPVNHQKYANNQIPATQISAIGAALAANYPAPNLPGTANNFVASPVETQSNNDFDVRVDYTISPKDLLFARYIYSRTYLFVPYPANIGTGLLPMAGVEDPDRGHNALLDETHIFSSKLVNELKIGFDRAALPVNWENPADEAGNLGIQGLSPIAYQIGGWPSFAPSGYAAIGTGSLQAAPENRDDSTYSILDSLSLVEGSHSLKFGMDLERIEIYQTLPGFTLGTFTFTGQYTNPSGGSGYGLPDMLLGYPSSTSKESDFASAWTYTVNPTSDFYALDDWALRKNLTLNLGVRYERDSPVYNKGGEQAGFNPATQTIQFAKITNPALSPSTIVPELPVPLPVPTVQTTRKSLCDNDWTDFAPRVGFAYRPFNDNTTVVRGGFGIFYNLQSSNNACTPVMGREFPWFYSQTYIGALGAGATPNISLNNAFPSALLNGSISIPAYVTRTPTPYIEEWNLALERQIGKSNVVNLSYVGSRGVHLPLSLNINQALLGTGAVSGWLPEIQRRPYYSLGLLNSVSLTSNEGYSFYDGLLARVERRATRDLTFLVTYTWSHSTDDGSATAIGGVADPGIQNNYNLAANRGSSTFDIRNRFVASYVFALPFGRGQAFGSSWNSIEDGVLGGWEVSGVFTDQGGFPLTARLAGDNSLTAGGADRPNIIGNPAISHPGPTQWLNPAAFSTPPLGSFGDEERGVMFGPGYVDWDTSFDKNFHLYRENTLQLRGELYDALNHPNFLNPSMTSNAPGFGAITSAHTPREIQLGLRYSF